MKRRGVHILSDQEVDCENFYAALSLGGFKTPEEVSSKIRLGTGRMYSPAKVLEIAEYCARVNGNVEIRYNTGINKDRHKTGFDQKTHIRWVTPDFLAWETDEAIAALTKALQEVRAKKGPL